ncbi:MAG: HPr(Ser) kinase/phosphatase [Gemmatimonadetes bacterium]|nr:HPr(Ser) kinase/phosphatase [Gemmatimonadota bacterium]
MAPLTVNDLFQRKQEMLQLEILTGDAGLDRIIPGPEASSPGLALAGFTKRFVSQRLHVLGETEIEYLRSLTPEDRQNTWRQFMSFDIPCVFVTKGQRVPKELISVAKEHGVPLIRSKLKTSEFYQRLTPYITEVFAPTTKLHGSLADVFGVGLLFLGRSGIGKSECVLDLVERGHRLVADDSVIITQHGTDVLIGRSPELTSHHMEIRGVGIIDVSALFGVHAVRQQKRIEVAVQLVDWEKADDADRTGLEARTTTILGVELPKMVVPLNPGKNITVVSEVVAMNHLLKYAGVDSAKVLNDRLVAQMAEQRELREYLTEDYE